MSAWMEVQLLLVAHRIDIVDGVLVGGNGDRTKLEDLHLEPQLAKDLLLLAQLFQKLDLDNAQLAVLSLALLYETVDEVRCKRRNNYNIEIFSTPMRARWSASSTTLCNASSRTTRPEVIRRNDAAVSLSCAIGSRCCASSRGATGQCSWRAQMRGS